MRQRVDPRDGEAEIGIEFVSNAERVGLEPEAEQSAVTIEGTLWLLDGKTRELACGHRHFAKPLGIQAYESHDPAGRPVGLHRLHAHRLVEKRTGKDLSFADRRFAAQRTLL